MLDLKKQNSMEKYQVIGVMSIEQGKIWEKITKS